jgi:hypothetical protein
MNVETRKEEILKLKFINLNLIFISIINVIEVK